MCGLLASMFKIERLERKGAPAIYRRKQPENGRVFSNAQDRIIAGPTVGDAALVDRIGGICARRVENVVSDPHLHDHIAI